MYKLTFDVHFSLVYVVLYSSINRVCCLWFKKTVFVASSTFLEIEIKSFSWSRKITLPRVFGVSYCTSTRDLGWATSPPVLYRCFTAEYYFHLRYAMEKPFKDEEDMAEFDSALDAILDVQLIPEVANGAQLNSSASPCNSSAALSSDNRDARSSDQQAPVLDMALSTIFRAFSDDADDTQLRKAEETCNSLIAKEKHMVRKKKAFHVHPSVVKNDFRHCFPQMYMNTLNSGDFEKVQDYYHTFMKSSTKFVADHTHVDNIFGPNLIEMYGPNLAIHYILGSSLMFPDLVMKTSGTRITTSPSWRGSRIEMDVEFRSTKMNNLPVDEWLPQASILEARYRKVVEVLPNRCAVLL